MDNLPTTTNATNAIAPFGSIAGFEAAQRMAQALASSDLVPARYQQNIGNCLIAMEISNRTGSSILAVMQSLYVVHGTPGWSGQYCIAALNRSSKFAEPIHFEFEGTLGKDDWGCRAVTTSKGGKRVEGPLVTIALAKAEGWYNRQGSKWRTIPELMLRYRAASWLAKTEAPELLMGMQTVEELRDMPPPEKEAKGVTLESLKAADPTTDQKVFDAVESPEPEPQGWPKWVDGQWVDSLGVIFDQHVHRGGTARDTTPPVNNDGTFRARRGQAVKARELSQAAKHEPPAEDTPEPETKEPALTESDVLGPIKFAIEGANSLVELNALVLDIQALPDNTDKKTAFHYWQARKDTIGESNA